MANSNHKPHQKHKKVATPPPSPEQLAAAKAAAEKAEADAKAERERIALYGKAVEKMSHRQLRSELTKTIRREHFKEGGKKLPVAGLTITFGTVLLAVLDNTRTASDVRLRKDQINPTATRSMNPGW